MKKIKDLFKYFFVCFVTLFILDILSFHFFKNEIQKVFPQYNVDEWRKYTHTFPQYHFLNDNELGFDIRSNYQTKYFKQPSEYKPYKAWGNSYGCFDDEWNSREIKGGIYLAGDSATWGFGSYENKFGTLVQEITTNIVYACGVTHTGQIHQFKKFKRLFKKGLKPSSVIVNMTFNDIDNDLYFPHSYIFHGFLVESLEVCGDINSLNSEITNYSINYLSYNDIQKNIESEHSSKTSKVAKLKEYSFSFNIFNSMRLQIVPRVEKYIKILIKKSYNIIGKELKDEVFKKNKKCFKTPYIGSQYLGKKYQKDKNSLPNRQAILNWIDHSIEHNYNLIFSLIPSKKNFRDETFPFIEKFIISSGGTVIKFSDYVKSQNITRKNLYYKHDGHFNDLGNKKYADFLIDKINELKLVP